MLPALTAPPCLRDYRKRESAANKKAATPAWCFNRSVDRCSLTLSENYAAGQFD